jgi:peptide-methionine (S)-S-oxide reductase
MRLLALSLATALVLGLANGVTAEDPPAVQPTAQSATTEPAEKGQEPEKAGEKEKEKEKPKLRPGTTQLATFGGGCFWCTEAVFQRIPGVRMVVSGYAGGNVPFPTYEMVCTGTTGHAEVVQIAFDPALVSYEKLLEVFWRSHNPTTPNAQGPDSGPQYRSIILYHDEEQKKAAESVYKALKARRVFHGTVVTQLEPYRGFFPAEAYHQNYYNNHPFDPYSLVYIAPKFDVFRKMAKAARKPAAKPEAPAAKTPADPAP